MANNSRCRSRKAESGSSNVGTTPDHVARCVCKGPRWSAMSNERRATIRRRRQKRMIVIVGAGPAGLALAHELQRRGVDYRVLEGGVVGESWRNHYDRLHLHTLKEVSGLPGLAMPDSYPPFPAGIQFHRYLARYAKEQGLNIEIGVTVEHATFAGALAPGDEPWRACSRHPGRRHRYLEHATARTFPRRRGIRRRDFPCARLSQRRPFRGAACAGGRRGQFRQRHRDRSARARCGDGDRDPRRGRLRAATDIAAGDARRRLVAPHPAAGTVTLSFD
jgi:hypothetical protein